MDLKFLLEFKGLKRIYEIEEDPEVMEDPFTLCAMRLHLTGSKLQLEYLA